MSYRLLEKSTGKYIRFKFQNEHGEWQEVFSWESKQDAEQALLVLEEAQPNANAQIVEVADA